jgi:hypothetical protein
VDFLARRACTSARQLGVEDNSPQRNYSWTDQLRRLLSRREPSVKSIEDLVDVVMAQHACEPSLPTASYELDAFERATGFPMPLDLRTFYTRIRRAEIHDRYRLLPIDEFQRTGAALQGDEWADSEPPSWYAFCDVLDGNFVGIDLKPTPVGQHHVLDCDHEDISSRRVIANSFHEFLESALSFDAGLYYLEFGEALTIEVPYRPPIQWLRRQYLKWSLDPEVGPRVCATENCGRLRVSLSVHCRRHHFEAINRLPYPFDD